MAPERQQSSPVGLIGRMGKEERKEEQCSSSNRRDQPDRWARLLIGLRVAHDGLRLQPHVLRSWAMPVSDIFCHRGTAWLSRFHNTYLWTQVEVAMGTAISIDIYFISVCI